MRFAGRVLPIHGSICYCLSVAACAHPAAAQSRASLREWRLSRFVRARILDSLTAAGQLCKVGTARSACGGAVAAASVPLSILFGAADTRDIANRLSFVAVFLVRAL
ncbi:hypothetical protein MRX96_016861 [Rhipicephalus microplus]